MKWAWIGFLDNTKDHSKYPISTKWMERMPAKGALPVLVKS